MRCYHCIKADSQMYSMTGPDCGTPVELGAMLLTAGHIVLLVALFVGVEWSAEIEETVEDIVDKKEKEK
jgi:hypothetical protein